MPRQRLDSGSTEQTPQSPGARAQISANTGAAGSDKRARRRAPNRKKALELHAGQAGSVVDKFYGSGKYHPQPISYGQRIKWVPVAAEYAKRSGKSLWAQPDMHLALLQYNITPPDATDNSIETRRQPGPAGPPERAIPPRIAPQRPTRNNRAPYLQHPHVGNGTDWGILNDVVHGIESGVRPVYTPIASAIIGGTQHAINRARGTTTSSAAPPGIQTIGAISDVAQPIEGATQDIQDWQAKYDSRFTQFNVPNIHIPMPGDPLTGTALAAAKGDQNAKAQLEDLRKQNKLRNWLPATTRDALRKQAVKNGWPIGEVTKIDDAALIERGLNYQPSIGRRLARGLATDLGTQIAFIPGMAAIGLAGLDSAQKGDITPLAKVVDQSFVQPVVQTVKHPVDSLIDHPLNTATLVMAAAHGGGKIAGKAVGLKPGDRIVSTPAIGGGNVRLGAKSTNLAIRTAQKIQETTIDPSRLQTSSVSPARAVGNALAKNAEKRQGKAVGRGANYQHRVLTHAEERKISNLTKHAKRALNKLDENQRKALFWTINYGTTPHEMAAMHLELARKAAEAGDAALATRQHVQANAYLSLDRAYQTIAGGGRDTAKADAAIAALRELQPGVDKALEDVGVAPVDLGQQASLAHPEVVASTVKAARDEHRAAMDALRSETAKTKTGARRAISDIKTSAARAQGDAAQIVRSSRDQTVRDAGTRVLDAAREIKRLGRAVAVEEAKRRRIAKNPTRIDHVDVSNGQIRGTSAPRRIGADGTSTRWDLRPGLSIVKTQFIGEDTAARATNASLEGAQRGFHERYVIVYGKGKHAIVSDGAGPRKFATPSEAVAYARRLDGINLARDAATVANDPKFQTVASGADPVGMLEQRLNDPGIAFDINRQEIAQQIADAGSTPHQRATAAYDAAVNRLANAYERLSEARRNAGESTPESDAHLAEARKLRAQADQLSALMQGRAPKEQIVAPADAPANVHSYVDARNREIAHAATRKDAIEQARQDAFAKVKADNPRAAFSFTPHQHGADLSGPMPGKARAAVDITTDATPRFANPRTDALYRRGEVNLSARSPVQAIEQAHTLKAIIDVGQRIWSDPQWSREAKAGDIIDKKHEVLVQVGGPKNVKRSFTNAAHDRMAASVQGVLDATDTHLTPEQIADLYTKQIIEPDSLVESGMVTVDPDTGVYRIKNGGELRIVKRAAVDAVVAYQKQRSGGRFGTSRPMRVAAKTSRIVRRSMLRSSIGTVTRNWQGIPQLALRGPVLTARAARQGMKGAIGKPVPIEWQVPDHILGKGLAGGDPYKAVGSKVAGFAIDVNGVRVMPIKPAAAYMDGLGTLNMVGEDATRALIYLGEAHKLARGETMNAVERIANRFGYTNEAFKNVLDDLKNQRDPRWVDLAKEVDRLAGDMTKVGQFDALASIALAFHRWYAHMLTLTLWTMPVRHPFRAYLIQSVSRAGEEYLKEHGVAPSFLMDSVIIASFILPKMGLNHAEELGWWAIGTQGGNVYATPASLLPIDKNGDPSVMAGAAGMLLPQYNAALIAANGNDPAAEIQGRDMLDQYGNVIKPRTTQAFAAAANTAMRSFPFVNILAPQTGMSPESLPWDQHRRRYTTPDGKTLPPEFAPPLIGDAGVNPYGDLTSTIMALARYAGFSPRLIPVQGNRTNIQHVKTVKAAKTKFSQEIHSRARSDGKG